MFGGMSNPAKLTKSQLLKLLEQKDDQLTQKDDQLTQKDDQLTQKDDQLEQKDDIIRQLEKKFSDLETAYAKLWGERFAAKSERYIDNPDQLRLDFNDSDEAADAADGLADAVEEAEHITVHRRRKPRKRRDESLPEHIERYEVIAEPTAAETNCETHGERTPLDESLWDTTEKLEYIPPKLRVRITKYPKYVCQGHPDCGITSPARPTGIVEGDKYDSGVAAQIISGKYGYHLPIYRQQDWFAGSGWIPTRSTLLNILTRCHFILEPLLEHFKQTVLKDSVIGCDDTGVTLLYPKQMPDLDLDDRKERRIHEVYQEAFKEQKPSIRAKMWAYRGATVKLNVFDFRVSRHRDGPEEFFDGYHGTLLGDCYSGFEPIVVASNGSILRAACNAHARRKIKESSAYPKERRQWLRWYQDLYDIETRGKELSPEERLALRQLEAKPIWQQMETELGALAARTKNVILPKSDFNQALNYLRNHSVELQRYLEDPLISFDNNETEQLMKQVAIGRKNWRVPDVLSRTSGRLVGSGRLVSNVHRTMAVWSAICI